MKIGKIKKLIKKLMPPNSTIHNCKRFEIHFTDQMPVIILNPFCTSFVKDNFLVYSVTESNNKKLMLSPRNVLGKHYEVDVTKVMFSLSDGDILYKSPIVVYFEDHNIFEVVIDEH